MANDVTDAMVDAFEKHAGFDALTPTGRKAVGRGLEAALAARPEPEGMETTAEEREAYAKAAETELVWPEAGFVERLLRDFDRLSAEIASLKAKLAEAEAAKAEAVRQLASVEDGDEAVKAETRKILVRCHDRIHALPRTSDTDLAIAIERLLGRLARGGST